MLASLRLWRLAFAAAAALFLAATTLRAVDVYEGVLQIAWQDPRPGSTVAGETHFSLALSDGRILELDMNGRQAMATTLMGARVIVSGTPGSAVGSARGASSPGTIVVDTIAPAAGFAAQDSVAAAPVVGTKKVIFVLLRFADDSAVPHAPAFYADLTNPDTAPAGLGIPATVNAFFKRTSNNQFSWVADVGGVGGIGAPGGWIALPQEKSYYAPCDFSQGCVSLSRLTADSIAAAKAQGIVFTPYDNINFVYSNDLDCCAWGGNWFFDGKSYGTTWEPPWGQDAEVYAHEMGHSLGLPHSGWVYHSYDSPWDVMSAHAVINRQSCGSYFSRNDGVNRGLLCGEPGDGYIAAHRDYLGWIPAPNTVVTDTTSSVTVTLEGAALPMGAGVKLIKVCVPGLPCTGPSANYFTIEARVKGGAGATQYDNGIPGEGVIVHDVQFARPAISGKCFFNNQSGWAVPIDATPGDYNSTTCGIAGFFFPAYGLYNAQFTAGQTFKSATYPFGIAVLSRAASTFTVLVGPVDTLPTIPAVTQQPASITRPTSARLATLSARATGTPAPTVRWQKRSADGAWADIVGATGTTYAVQVAGLQSGTAFRAVFTNVVGSVASDPATVTVRAGQPSITNDVDGDGITDATVWHGASGMWQTVGSRNGYAVGSPLLTQWGSASLGDIPFLADIDGDGIGDLIIWRPSDGTWYWLTSSTGYAYVSAGARQWGNTRLGDVPLVADMDGDTRVDLVIWRASTGTFYWLTSSSGYSYAVANGVQWGNTSLGDQPLLGDFDGDGKADPVIWRASNGTWYWLSSAANYSYASARGMQWGTSILHDIPLIGDIDGDGKTDLIVWRPGNGAWFWLKSSTGYTYATQEHALWGNQGLGDIPMAGDFDGDGKSDLVVWRASTGSWYWLTSSSRYALGNSIGGNGAPGDVPLVVR